ncbi:DUF308 domain-containing protein [Vagococcus sp. PNs007]|uniref:DUF308 domain-containing protein n=1 Tax=Vagococcus proximus TaxID=2991417 RepID=A0ABT5X409_9ENTE|nr:DUF308 domain-containing protein [Vagococcus proximus]MDF0480740.1 DUF308 domain-containing protein [Vagococcus proximus]
MNRRQKSFDWLSLILGMLFIVTALFSLKASPISNLGIVVVFFTLLLITKGISMLVIRSRVKLYLDISVTPLLIVGILDILMGCYFIFNLSKGIMIAPYVFSIWFLIDAFMGLFDLGWIKKVSMTFFWLTLVSSTIGIIIGFMLLVSPIVSALTLSFLVGFNLLNVGITYIIRAFPIK